MTADNNMESVYERELKGRSPSKLKTLSLAGAKSKEISGLPSSDLINLETLNLESIGISSLKGLPKFPKLSTLNLANNQLDGTDLESLVESCPKLEKLVLKGNPIKDISKLKPLAKLESLKDVDVSESDAASDKDFQNKLLDVIPQLKNQQKNGKKSADADGAAGEEESDGDEDEEDSDDDDDEDDDVGLKALNKDFGEDDDDDDFKGEGDDDDEEEEDDDEDDDLEESGGADEPISPPAKEKRGVKRPAEDDGNK